MSLDLAARATVCVDHSQQACRAAANEALQMRFVDAAVSGHEGARGLSIRSDADLKLNSHRVEEFAVNQFAACRCK